MGYNDLCSNMKRPLKVKHRQDDNAGVKAFVHLKITRLHKEFTKKRSKYEGKWKET